MYVCGDDVIERENTRGWRMVFFHAFPPLTAAQSIISVVVFVFEITSSNRRTKRVQPLYDIVNGLHTHCNKRPP